MDKWLNHPTSLKVLSLILAILIWAIVHIDPETSPQSVTSNTDTKIIEAATIVPIGLDTDKYVLTGLEPTVVRVVVEGRISNLRTATNDDYVVQLDLNGVGPGIQDLPLKVQMPAGIKEVEISPSHVTVQIEELETQTLEVQVLTEGEPAAGYIVGESSIIGDTGNVVEVTMPKDDYARLGMLAVTVDITGASANVTNKKAKVVAYDTQGVLIPNVSVKPDTLSAETIISLPSKELPVQLRYTGNLPEGYSLVSINSSTTSVTVNATQTILDEMNLYDGFVLDLAKVKESGEVLVKAEKSENGLTVTPGEIPVIVEIEATATRTMSGIPVTITGLVDDTKATISESKNGRIDVLLAGAETLLQKIKNSEVKLSLDVTGLAIGTHQLTVAAELPAYIHATESESFTLNVTVVIASTKEVDASGENDGVDNVIPDLPTSGPDNGNDSTDPEPSTDVNEEPTESPASSGNGQVE
ncbi:CdaR family protein [Paenibacillus endoradicis]|uniref:CdaR family protein n=1 Tax=Paenibacillus endoradicis TaxID=2972487 RepID=UPI002159AFF4|nr:CdaR family protein [Paenibacillus endoradicis]MCR8657719.1 CdaR family protein [Paenibacillus endoradicis]